jgi:hypothetical protein
MKESYSSPQLFKQRHPQEQSPYSKNLLKSFQESDEGSPFIGGRAEQPSSKRKTEEEHRKKQPPKYSYEGAASERDSLESGSRGRSTKTPQMKSTGIGNVKGKPGINQMHKNASESNLLHGRTDNYPHTVNSSLNPYLKPNLPSHQFRHSDFSQIANLKRVNAQLEKSFMQLQKQHSKVSLFIC